MLAYLWVARMQEAAIRRARRVDCRAYIGLRRQGLRCHLGRGVLPHRAVSPVDGTVIRWDATGAWVEGSK